MQAVVLSIHLILALALIVVVLLQRSEGGALGMGGGGVMTSRGAATALSKLTWMLGAAFVVTSLALTIIAARDSRSDSVIEGLGTTAPASQSTPGRWCR
ncbi:MAG TPA: preprotein translocase subunit SecG, partial [Amaricoccus sp.]|nr:preprotein translocase subunit SecG [Amaricoccus sp.]